MDTEDILDIVKQFLDILPVSKMRVIYTEFPAVILEFTTDCKFKISVEYLYYKSFVFDTAQDIFLFLTKLSLKRTISRVDLSNKSTTVVLYGDLFYHELEYADKFKTIRYR